MTPAEIESVARALSDFMFGDPSEWTDLTETAKVAITAIDAYRIPRRTIGSPPD